MNPWGGLTKLPKQELINIQNKRLHTFINQFLYPFSPHYRKVFDEQKIDPRQIKTIADLQRIPFTSKLDLIDDNDSQKFKEFVLQPDKEKIQKFWPLGKKLNILGEQLLQGKEACDFSLLKEFKPVFMTFTTGTTNTPVPFLYTNYDIQNLYTSGARMLHLFDVAKNATLINTFPYAPHLAFWQVVFGGFASCSLALSTGGGKVMGTDGNLAAIEKMKPTVILGVPSYVYHILREAKEKNLHMPYVKKVVLGASRITPGFKIKIAELLEAMGATDVSVFGTYGFTESRCAWAESPTELDQSSGYHLYPDKEIFEIIDPHTGEVKKEGEDGELVYTSLDSRGSSVIRYRTGDFVRGGITYEPCPFSGTTVPRISSDITRLSDVKDLQLSKVKGSLINFNHFSAILSDIDLVEEWQIEIRKKNNDPYDMDELIVYVSSPKSKVKEQLTAEVKEKITLATEVSPNDVIFISRKEMVKRLELETANKERRILDNRPKQ